MIEDTFVNKTLCTSVDNHFSIVPRTHSRCSSILKDHLLKVSSSTTNGPSFPFLEAILELATRALEQVDSVLFNFTEVDMDCPFCLPSLLIICTATSAHMKGKLLSLCLTFTYYSAICPKKLLVEIHAWIDTAMLYTCQSTAFEAFFWPSKLADVLRLKLFF